MYKLIEKMNDLNNFTSTNHFIDYIYKEDIKPIIQSSLDKFFELEEKWENESNKDINNSLQYEVEMEAIETDIKSEFQSIYENYEIDYRSAFELYENYENDIDDLLQFPLSEYMYDKDTTLDKLIERVIEEAYTHALIFIYDFMD